DHPGEQDAGLAPLGAGRRGGRGGRGGGHGSRNSSTTSTWLEVTSTVVGTTPAATSGMSGSSSCSEVRKVTCDQGCRAGEAADTMTSSGPSSPWEAWTRPAAVTARAGALPWSGAVTYARPASRAAADTAYAPAWSRPNVPTR